MKIIENNVLTCVNFKYDDFEFPAIRFVLSITSKFTSYFGLLDAFVPLNLIEKMTPRQQIQTFPVWFLTFDISTQKLIGVLLM